MLSRNIKFTSIQKSFQNTVGGKNPEEEKLNADILGSNDTEEITDLINELGNGNMNLYQSTVNKLSEDVKQDLANKFPQFKEILKGKLGDRYHYNPIGQNSMPPFASFNNYNTEADFKEFPQMSPKERSLAFISSNVFGSNPQTSSDWLKYFSQSGDKADNIIKNLIEQEIGNYFNPVERDIQMFPGGVINALLSVPNNNMNPEQKELLNLLVDKAGVIFKPEELSEIHSHGDKYPHDYLLAVKNGHEKVAEEILNSLPNDVAKDLEQINRALDSLKDVEIGDTKIQDVPKQILPANNGLNIENRGRNSTDGGSGRF